MDYQQWGAEYLREAETLKTRVDILKEKLKSVSGKEEILLYRRISMLDTIYLECLHTGRYLMERAETA